jgi:hypothetical protein
MAAALVLVGDFETSLLTKYAPMAVVPSVAIAS